MALEQPDMESPSHAIGQRLSDGSVLIDHHVELEEKPTRERSDSQMRMGDPECIMSSYGNPLSPEEAMEALPPGPGGIIWHAQLLPDDMIDPKVCNRDGDIRPRRGNLPVRVSEFFSSLTRTPDGRWIFCGVLNGWPGLNCLELRSITSKTGLGGVSRLWDASKNPDGLEPPQVSGPSVRATLRMAPWSAKGWTRESPRYVFWFFGQRPGEPRMGFGESMRDRLRVDLAAQAPLGGVPPQPPQAVAAHLFAHRYALGPGKVESNRDLLTYHSAVLLEWDHGRYTTVVELATVNGVGGRRGKSNWYHDRDEESPAMYRAMPAQLVAPFRWELAEIRANDVEARSIDEFKDFINQYVGMDKRFLDPHFPLSGPVRLSYRSQDDVMRFLMNYMARDRRYTEEFRNCQAFAADFYGFVCGKKDIEPFGAISRATYKNRSHLFIYDPDMYDSPAAEQ